MVYTPWNLHSHLRCPEWLRVGQAKPWRGPAAVHRYPGPWFIWMQLLTWYNSWASSQHGRQASGPGKKTRSARASWAEAKLGPNLKHKSEFFQGWSSCALWLTNLKHHDWRSCEYLILLLFSLFFTKIKLNSISQSDQSSWKTFCESLYRKSSR